MGLQVDWNFIADITHQGEGTPDPVAPVIEYIRKFLIRQKDGSSGKTIWYVRPDQRRSLPERSDFVTIVECESPLSGRELLARIQAECPTGHVEWPLVLFSYNREGLTVVAEQFDKVAVIPVPISLLPGFPCETPAEKAHALNRAVKPIDPKTVVGEGDPPLTFGDAIRLVQTLLRQKNALSSETALDLTKLRPLIEGVDSRAKKSGAIPGSLKMIRSIVGDGELNGWIARTCAGPGPVGVYLIGEAAAEMNKASAAPPKQVNRPIAVRSASESPQTVSGYKRDKFMVDALCARGVAMWTPGELREYLSCALGTIMEDCKTRRTAINAQELIGQVVDRAKATAEQQEFPRSVKWDATGQCFLRNLIAAECLKDANGQTIRSPWVTGAKKVADLADEWMLRIEGSLILTILRSVPDIRLTDEYSLALALYQRGADRAIPTTVLHQKIAIVIEYLEQAHLINIEGDRLILAPSRLLAQSSAIIP